MAEKHFILATAGHVDHGKSSLVKALTGTDPDRLPEEKARGITIDLGFAHLELPAPATSAPGSNPPATYSIGIVDVPGHEDFVKNMVAGVGSIDVALLIVAADDAWMPQTEEHLQILAYLGVNRGVVALTKIDLAQGTEEAVIDSVREKLLGTPLAEAPIVPTSVVSGRGIPELKIALAEVLADAPAPRDISKPRLPVDRVFTLRGIGTVVTGTLSGGVLRRGQPVIVQPSGLAAKVRSVQSHSNEVKASIPGTRTALSLPDVANRSDQQTEGVARGDVITLPELGKPSNTLDAVIEKSGRLAGLKHPAAKPLKDGAIVRVHHGSGNFPARIVLLDQKQPLEPGGRVFGQLRTESPVYALAGDHFIIRDWSEQTTLGGGIILDPDGNRKHYRREIDRRFMEARAAAPADVAVFVASQLLRDRARQRNGLLVKSRFSAAEITAAVDALIGAKTIVEAAGWLVDSEWWQSMKLRAAEAIDAEHKAKPQLLGLELNALRSALGKAFPTPALFDPLVADLCRSGFAQSGTLVRRLTHRPALPPQLQAAGQKVRASLSAKPFEPPNRKEIAPDALTQQALRFLLQTGEAVDIGPDAVLLTDSYNQIAEIVKRHIREHGGATVSDLRQAVGASRRIMVPLLERLDRDGITRRDGDKRLLKNP